MHILQENKGKYKLQFCTPVDLKDYGEYIAPVNSIHTHAYCTSNKLCVLSCAIVYSPVIDSCEAKVSSTISIYHYGLVFVWPGNDSAQIQALEVKLGVLHKCAGIRCDLEIGHGAG